MTPAIDIAGLQVEFPDGTLGVDGVSMAVEPHEFLTLVGPSGSGKTTLLRAVAGFAQPSAGSVSIAGRDVTGLPPERREIGMVFQSHAVWPHLSVAKNIAYPLERRRLPRGEVAERVERVLRLVGLPGLGRRRPEQLSGGQRQRVALARAVVAQPLVLLFDEALSALDEPLRDALRRELVGLTKREGLTAIHVTHDRSEALALGDRVAVLSEGRLRQLATPAELLERPASAAVAQFIADATLVPAAREGDEAVALGGALRLPVARLDGAPRAAAMTLALTATHTRLVSPEEPGALRGTISSALFTGRGYSATVLAGGETFRADAGIRRPVEGEPVGLVVDGALAYERSSEE